MFFTFGEDPVGMEAKTVHDAESLGFVAECKSYWSACQPRSACIEPTLAKWGAELGLDSTNINIDERGETMATIHIGDLIELDSGSCRMLAEFAEFYLVQACGQASRMTIRTHGAELVLHPSASQIMNDSMRYSGAYRALVIEIVRESGRDDLLQLNAIFHMLRNAFPGFTHKGDLWGALSDYMNNTNEYLENPSEVLVLFAVSCDYPEFGIRLPNALRAVLPAPPTIQLSQDSIPE